MAALIGAAGPPLLARPQWLDNNPAVGVVLWLAALWTAVTALVTGVAVLAFGTPFLGDAAADLLRACALAVHERMGSHLAASLAAFTILMLGGLGLLVHSLRYWLLRRWFLARHRAALDLVSRFDARRGVWIVDHPDPTAYSVPGRPGRVVLSTGTLEILEPAEVAAVISHERAHLRGRHHLLTALTRNCAAAFRFLPVARRAPTTVGYLLERVADEVACRNHEPLSLAKALRVMSLGGAAQSRLLGASEAAIERRLWRLHHRPSSRSTSRTAVYLASGALALAPLILLIGVGMNLAGADHCVLPPPTTA